jgi:hypothetical protein
MKKIFVAMIAIGMVSVPFAASAKLGKITKSKFSKKGGLTIGAYAIGGPTAVNAGLLGFNNINDDDADSEDKQSTFGIAPTIGYFVIDGLEIELGFAYASGGTDDSSRSNWAIAPAIRYYLGVARKYGMFPFFAVSYMYGGSSMEMSGGGGAAAAAPAPAPAPMAAPMAAPMGTTMPAPMMTAPAASASTTIDSTITDLSFGAGITQALGTKQGGFISLGLEYHIMSSEADVTGAKEQKYSGLNVGVKFGVFLN